MTDEEFATLQAEHAETQQVYDEAMARYRKYRRIMWLWVGVAALSTACAVWLICSLIVAGT